MKTFWLLPVLLASALYSQNPPTSLNCDSAGWRTNGLDNYCVITETNVAFSGGLSVNSVNGSVSIESWDGDSVLIRAKIQTAASSLAAAIALAGLIGVDISGSLVKSVGPAQNSGQAWSVAYEIFVPPATNLDLSVANGALTVSDVTGNIQFNVANGASALAGLGGDVTGKVANGAVSIALSGDHWDGAGLSVKAANGAVSVTVPYYYSAHFNASTTLGTVSTNFPVPAHSAGGFWGKLGLGGSLVFDAGSGGAPITLSTSLGTVRIQRLPAAD
jgi:hypothetical protein